MNIKNHANWRLYTILKRSNKSAWSNVFRLYKYIYYEILFNTLYIGIKHKC